MWCWRRIDKMIKWSEKATNKQVIERIGLKRSLLNNILRRKANWIGHSLRRNCLLHDDIEGQMTEGRVKRSKTQLLIDIRTLDLEASTLPRGHRGRLVFMPGFTVYFSMLSIKKRVCD